MLHLQKAIKGPLCKLNLLQKFQKTKYSSFEQIPNGITRFHGRFRYDENFKIKEDKNYEKVI